MHFESDERYYKKLKVVHLIYKEKKTQQDVAKLLNISRPTLAKMINEAMEEGILKVEISDIRNSASLLDLELRVVNKYKLKDAVIVDCSAPDNNGEIIDNIGKAAALYFESQLRSKMTIGVSWGKTIESFVSNLHENKGIDHLKIVTLVGGMLYAESNYHATILAQRILDKYCGEGFFIYAPTYASSAEEYQVWMQNKELHKVLEIGKKVDIALVGIGASLSYYSELNKLLHNIKISQYGKVGGINAQFFDIDGHLISDTNKNADDIEVDTNYIQEINNLFIGIKLDDLKKNKTVIALAGGNEKHLAIRAAILGGYANVLVTDKYTAQFLINGK